MGDKGDSADWNEENTTIVCELFAEQVLSHNRSGTHLNRIGYQNVIDKFKERTGLTYTKMQLKNKWDKLRKDYSHWRRLEKETGIGWDPVKKTYQAPNDWWKKANKQYKGIAKFKDGLLAHEEQMTIMFEDIRNTRDDHWAPSSGVLPEPVEVENTNDDNDHDEDYVASDDCVELTPFVVKAKRPARVTQKDKGKRPKNSGGHWLQDQVTKLVSCSEKTTASCESLAKKEDTSGFSIKDCMALVKECGATPGTQEHLMASNLFVKRAEREIFMTLETPAERFQYLQMKHQWVTRNDVPK